MNTFKRTYKYKHVHIHTNILTQTHVYGYTHTFLFELNQTGLENSHTACCIPPFKAPHSTYASFAIFAGADGHIL